MAKKLSDSARIIRELQLHYTNRQIADMLGYKDVGSINRISRNKRNFSASKLEQARNILTQNNHNIHKRPPSRTTIQQKQKKIRLTFNWTKSSRGHFIDAVQPVLSLFQLLGKLQSLSLHFFYYNANLNIFLISDSHLNLENVPTNITTGLLYESSYTKSEGNIEKELQVVQYPVFPFPTVLKDSSFTSWNQMNADELQFELDRKNDDVVPEDDEFRYEFIAELEELRFLAFVSMGRG